MGLVALLSGGGWVSRKYLGCDNGRELRGVGIVIGSWVPAEETGVFDR